MPKLLDGVRLGKAKPDAIRLLERIWLGNRTDHRPAELSGGQMQRVAVARAPDTYPTDALPQGLSEKLAVLPGVAHVAEGAFGFAEVGGTRVMLDGFASGTADPLYRALDQQTRDQVLAGHGVVLTQNLGKTLHVRVGDPLRMQTPHGVQQARMLALVPTSPRSAARSA